MDRRSEELRDRPPMAADSDSLRSSGSRQKRCSEELANEARRPSSSESSRFSMLEETAGCSSEEEGSELDSSEVWWW